MLTVRIPDPGSLAALRALVAGLAGDPALAHADIPTVPVTTELPSNIPAATSPRCGRSWPRSPRAPGTRARRSPARRRPPLVVDRLLRAGPPGPEVAVQETAADFATGNPNRARLHDPRPAAGTFDPGAVANLAADQVTGMWPGPDLPLRVVDLRIRSPARRSRTGCSRWCGALPGDVVVNTSLAAGCAPTGLHGRARFRPTRSSGSRACAAAGSRAGSCTSSAAGNIYPNLLTDTDGAARQPLQRRGATPLPGVRQPHEHDRGREHDLVGPGGRTRATAVPDGHLQARRPHLRGRQRHQVSFSAPGVPRDLPAGGTSSAAPQVAGAAATVWALDPGLSPAAGGRHSCATPRGRSTSTRRRLALRPHRAARTGARRSTPRSWPPTARAAHRCGRPSSTGRHDGTFDARRDLRPGRPATRSSPLSVDHGAARLRPLRPERRRPHRRRTRPASTSTRAAGRVGLQPAPRRARPEVLHDENAVRDLDVLCHEAHRPALHGRRRGPRHVRRGATACRTVELFESTRRSRPRLSPGQTTQLRIVAPDTDLGDPAVAQLPGVHLDFSAVQRHGRRRDGHHRAGRVVHHHRDAVGPSGAIDGRGHRPRRRGRPGARPHHRHRVAGSGSVTLGDGKTLPRRERRGRRRGDRERRPQLLGQVSGRQGRDGIVDGDHSASALERRYGVHGERQHHAPATTAEVATRRPMSSASSR